MDTFTIEPQGLFSLDEAAQFGFGQRKGERHFDGTMRLAFCVDGYRHHAGVSLTQAAGGIVHGTIWTATDRTDRMDRTDRTDRRNGSDPTGAEDREGPANRDAVIAQVARVLSIDWDATGYQAVGNRDPVVARLLEAAPGLRPPLFYSLYEAALWAVISIRRPGSTAERWRTRLSQVAGAGFDVAGTEMWAVPTPKRIVEMGVAGVMAATAMEEARAERVVGVAEAAEAGALDAVTLATMGEDEARAQLRTIAGIGPFYADLVAIRATGITDVLPLNEPRLLALLGMLYGAGGPMTPKAAEQLADAWHPWRTWVAVLVRVAGPRILAPA
jgi:DNA-3-methyladenine glycosylase II